MKKYLISMFIDDELNFDEKIKFVEQVHQDPVFKDESIGLIEQEKYLRQEVVDSIPHMEVIPAQKGKMHFFRPIKVAFGVLVLAAAIFMAFVFLLAKANTTIPYRFVIYQPDVTQAEIVGSFTGWKRFPMNQKGDSGYWEVILNLSESEHRFSYILEGSMQIADPTIMMREEDDFGGVNSILPIRSRT